MHAAGFQKGTLRRAPPARPSCKLSRAVVYSNQDGARQVRPLRASQVQVQFLGPAQLGLRGGFGAHRSLSLRARRAGDAPTLTEGLTPLTASLLSTAHCSSPTPRTATLVPHTPVTVERIDNRDVCEENFNASLCYLLLVYSIP